VAFWLRWDMAVGLYLDPELIDELNGGGCGIARSNQIKHFRSVTSNRQRKRRDSGAIFPEGSRMLASTENNEMVNNSWLADVG
jgi:hypothetical protein